MSQWFTRRNSRRAFQKLSARRLIEVGKTVGLVPDTPTTSPKDAKLTSSTPWATMEGPRKTSASGIVFDDETPFPAARCRFNPVEWYSIDTDKGLGHLQETSTR